MLKNFIGGEWVAGTETMDNINPSDTSDVIHQFSLGNTELVDSAVAAAKAAAPIWRQSHPQQRFQILDKIADAIFARLDELGDLLAREEGKTLPEAKGEVGRAAWIFKYFAGEVLRNPGELLPSVRPGVACEVVREPLGVVGLITPWNFPIAIPAWKIAPALAYGNTVVFKPAELTPGCAYELSRIIADSGLPDGAFNMVFGRGADVGAALVDHQDVDGISFTGSVAVGGGVAARCAQRMARVQLEMGGKNPMVVLDDADLDVAVNTSLNGAFFSTGQRCTASSRLIVTEGIHDRFVEQLQGRMKDLVIGDARAKGTQIGPAVDGRQLEKNLSYLEIGQKEGAKLVAGGQRLELAKQGFYMQPALFTETNNAMHINRDEIFGPIASVIRVADYEEALAVANDTRFGLSSGICTSSLKHASHFRQHARAGMVMVNLPTAGVDYHVPFGGTKGSSYGTREQGRYAAEFYTTVKTSYIAS